jgi:hypothetical protein
MIVANGEVDAEPVPRIFVPVFKMVAQAAAQIAGQADVVELAAAKERVDSLSPADVFPDDVLVLLEDPAGDAFEVLCYEGFGAGHGG